MPKLPNSTSGWPRTTSVSCPITTARDLVDQTISKVSHTIFQGIALVFIVLILFLGSPRSALIVGNHDSVRHDDGFHPDEPA